MAFLVMLMLSDRGELDFDAEVATYWPEFAAEGKTDVKVHHLMNHTAGLSGFSPAIRQEDLADWERCTIDLAQAAPWWSDRSQSGYHMVTQGYLLGELVRRITGTTIGQYFAVEVADVLGADFYIGLPESEESRVSVVVAPENLGIRLDDSSSLRFRTVTSPRIDPRVPAQRWWRAAEISAANGHGNARSVATIQQIISNNGHANGHRFVSERTLERVFHPVTSGVDLVLGFEGNFGLGYGLKSSYVPIGPRGCYWGGFGGSVIFMDQDLELTVAYDMNKMAVGLVGDTRGATFALAAALATTA
ncbi:MAG TPA: serine hydrolase domain-containing protein, partial [Acidimicrobiales bacterium]|jgi:CubicO group peptidase (beta-lactamase class C family)|nr:serine hydrolase domain-containing protein [Acidimicrobiales bacterium]